MRSGGCVGSGFAAPPTAPPQPSRLLGSVSSAAGASAGSFLLRLVKDPHLQKGAAAGAAILEELQGRSRASSSAPGLDKADITDGILEASWHIDGRIYIELDGEWVEATGKFWCSYCWAFGNNLQAHVDSSHHAAQRRAWHQSSFLRWM